MEGKKTMLFNLSFMNTEVKTAIAFELVIYVPIPLFQLIADIFVAEQKKNACLIKAKIKLRICVRYARNIYNYILSVVFWENNKLLTEK